MEKVESAYIFFYHTACTLGLFSFRWKERLKRTFTVQHFYRIHKESSCYVHILQVTIGDKLYFTPRIMQKHLGQNTNVALSPHHLLSSSKQNFSFRVLLMLSFRRKARPLCWLTDFNRHWRSHICQYHGLHSSLVSSFVCTLRWLPFDRIY